MSFTLGRSEFLFAEWEKCANHINMPEDDILAVPRCIICGAENQTCRTFLQNAGGSGSHGTSQPDSEDHPEDGTQAGS